MEKLNQHDKTKYMAQREFLSYREPFNADYIWIKDNGTAVWAAFSKDIILDKDVDKAIFDISCDTHYWLWVNGEEIVWEGCLKRGITPDNGFFDRIEINNKFKAGVNTISVLVRHLGDDGFSHKDSGFGGFVLEGTYGVYVMTDSSWKAKKFAYRFKSSDSIKNLNFRLSERGSTIIGRDYTEFWKQPSDPNWANAIVYDKAQSQKYFGRSYLNPLPNKVVEDTVYFDLNKTNSGKYVFKLDVNAQFCPYFEFVADKDGRKLVYYTENKFFNYKNTYIAKKGENKFLDFAWINGERLTVIVGGGITLKKVGYRKSGYDAKIINGFKSSDSALNSLWQKSANTLKVTMRDSYMDCPDRERAQWIGDAVIENEMSFYSLTPQSSALFRKAIITTYGWIHENGVIQTVVPNGDRSFELPMQNLAFLVGCVDYVKYSGDDSVLPMIRSMAQGYLPLWEIKDDLIVHRKGSWDWGDWGSKIDVPALENAWYYYALQKILTIVEPSDKFASFLTERMSIIKKGFEKFITPFGITSGQKPDDRANAMAVIAGLVKEEDKNGVLDVLVNVKNSSPYMEKYVEQALCVLGRVDLALMRAKQVYSAMIKDDCTTLWEFWAKWRGTTNHAWAGGTLFILSRYVGGIYPTKNGFSEFEIRPDFSVLKDFSVSLNPVFGVEISVNAESKDTKRKLTVNCSSDGGKLVVYGKNFVYNGVKIDTSPETEKEFVLKVGVNELIFDA